MFNDTGEMEDQDLEGIFVSRGQVVDRMLEFCDSVCIVVCIGGMSRMVLIKIVSLVVSHGFKELVVYIVSNKRRGQLAKVLFQTRSDGVNVKVRVGNVVVVVSFEAFFDDLDLAGTAGFSINTLNIDAYR